MMSGFIEESLREDYIIKKGLSFVLPNELERESSSELTP